MQRLAIRRILLSTGCQYGQHERDATARYKKPDALRLLNRRQSLNAASHTILEERPNLPGEDGTWKQWGTAACTAWEDVIICQRVTDYHRAGMGMHVTLLAAQRRKQILDEVRTHGAVRIADLARRLGVSEMTIHRDLDRLAAEGLVRKVFGGAVAVESLAVQPHCTICGTLPEKRLDFTVHTRDGTRAVACCPHCGLLLVRRLGAQVQSAVTFDFVTRQPVNARAAVYVVESTATPCCAPSLLAFARREDAVRFQAGFGGRLATFQQAVEWLEAMGLASGKGE